MIHFYLRPITKNENSSNIYNKIIGYLMTFVGDIEVKKESETSTTIYYVGSPATAFLKLEKTGQLTVNVSPDDNITISLINNMAQSLGFRVYNPQINAFLPNDVNIYDLTTIKVDPNVKNLLNLYRLTPLFQYRNTLIFFCLNKKMEVVLVNRHFLEFIINSEKLIINTKEIAVKVAENISQFIALFDRGLINLTNPDSVIINLSKFDLQNLPKDTKLNIINFIFDEENQNFMQTGTSEKLPKKYLALKISQDYNYSMIDDKLTKIINVSVFL